LTSAAKNMDVATYLAVKDFANDELSAGLFTGTLANEGIGLAPYHDQDNNIPQECKDAVDAASAALVAGNVTTGYEG